MLWRRRMTSIFGAVYVPMECLLFLLFPSIRCNGMHPVYALILGLMAVAILVSAVPLQHGVVALSAVMAAIGVAMALLMSAATELYQSVVLRNRSSFYKKPVVAVFTVASRCGLVAGSLIGGRAADSFRLRTVYLIVAALPLLYSPTLIYLLRETHHEHSAAAHRHHVAAANGNKHFRK